MGSHTAPKKFVSESKDNPIKSFQEKTGFAQAASNASFVPSWSSGDLFSSQTAFTFGRYNFWQHYLLKFNCLFKGDCINIDLNIRNEL